MGKAKGNMRKKRIFIFAYYSYYDPIFQSAVLPYFESLAPQEEFEFILLTFEQKKYSVTKEEAFLIKQELKKKHILWYKTQWHSGRFKLLKKIFSFCWGILLSAFLLLKYRVKAIYAEGVLSGVFGYFLSRIFNVPLIVHSYEPHTDYMIEGKVWTPNFWGARLLKHYEYVMGMRAQYIFTGTQNMIDRLKGWHSPAKVFRVPSCVDCELFKPSEQTRVEVRKKLGIAENTIVVTYLGKFGDIYMEEEIIDFFNYSHKAALFDVRFIIITPDDHQKIRGYIANKKMDESLFHITTLRKKDIPPYLNASDFGFVPVKQSPSRKFCSPIKDGEYWASGVPLLIFKGISDDYLVAEEKKIGIVLDDTTHESYKKTVEQMHQWIYTGQITEAKQRCVAYAREDRDVRKYAALYQNVFSECL